MATTPTNVIQAVASIRQAFYKENPRRLGNEQPAGGALAGADSAALLAGKKHTGWRDNHRLGMVELLLNDHGLSVDGLLLHHHPLGLNDHRLGVMADNDLLRLDHNPLNASATTEERRSITSQTEQPNKGQESETHRITYLSLISSK